MMMKFYKCKRCGQVIAMVENTSLPITCCDEVMSELTPHEYEEELIEKHVPTYKIHKGKLTVKVGELMHPMIKEHFIKWIAIVTDKGNQRKCLKPGSAPSVTFMLEDDEKVKTIFAYCNIHGLWKIDLD